MYQLSKDIKRFLLIAILLVTTIGSDQVTKSIARSSLSYQPVSFFGDMLRLQRSENTGAFLSTGAELNSESRFYLFTVAVSIFLLIVFFILLKNRSLSSVTIISWSLIVGGGTGNLIDRALKGSVTDFLNVGIGSLRTGIFNVADMVIVVGVVLLFFANRAKAGIDSSTV